MAAAYLPLTFLLGRFGPLLLVVVYIALTIFAELMPDRFLAAFGEAGRDVAEDMPAGGRPPLRTGADGRPPAPGDVEAQDRGKRHRRRH
jgi:hypothetical protein